jgi:hypothetical protein
VALDDLALRPGAGQSGASVVDGVELTAMTGPGAQLLVERVVERAPQPSEVALVSAQRSGGGALDEPVVATLDRVDECPSRERDSLHGRLELCGDVLRVTDGACEVDAPGPLVARPGISHGSKPIPRIHAASLQSMLH